MEQQKEFNLTLKRTYPLDNYTIGELYIEGEYYCDTLEDTVREEKIAGKTAIPYGKYEVIVNRSPRFKRDLPLLLDVPNFEGIRIHRGNTDKDTSGCILVGENKVVGKVINSTEKEEYITKLLKEAISLDYKVFIEITE